MSANIVKYVATKNDLENLILKDAFRQSQTEVCTRLDEIITMLLRLEQDWHFTFEYLVNKLCRAVTSINSS